MKCFVALGGNIGDVHSSIAQAVSLLKKLVENFQLSPLYRTTAVSPIPQPHYINAVCSFQCTLSPLQLFYSLQAIERKIGKIPKPKNAPRLIDLDLLFYGEKILFTKDLILPHPRWHERLFVVAPLADLTQTLPYGIDVKELIEKFPNIHGEKVKLDEKGTYSRFLDWTK